MDLDILAIGAHPDDIEITCAGTIVKLVTSGKRVGIVDLTEGELGTRGSRALRREEATNAASVLGITRENLGIPDGNITVSRENILRLMLIIRRRKPHTLLIPYGQDRHPDHVHAHTLCKEAWFYAGLGKIETVDDGVAQGPHRPGMLIQYMQWFEFSPSFIVDVTESWPRRMDAMRAYKSQFHNPTSSDPQTALSSPGFFDFIETRARYYGSRIGVQYGEPFFLERTPGISDLLAIL
jgi:bacillithiol biosynthesis deacetylase BshB1